jgi:hypothetical protein
MKNQVLGDLRDDIINTDSTMSEDALSRLSLFPGMEVMVTANIAFSKGVVNGAEGIIHSIKFNTDEENQCFVTVIYIHIPGAGIISKDLVTGTDTVTYIYIIQPHSLFSTIVYHYVQRTFYL